MGLLNKSNKQSLTTSNLIIEEFANIWRVYQLNADWHWNTEPWGKFLSFVANISPKLYSKVPSVSDAILIDWTNIGFRFFIIDNTNHKRYQMYPYRSGEWGFVNAWNEISMASDISHNVCFRVSQATIKELLNIKFRKDGSITKTK